MADNSWINPLMANARGLFGLDPRAAAEGANLQAERDYKNAQTTQYIPAQVKELEGRTGVHKATVGKLGAETEGITLKNTGSKESYSFLADPDNYIIAPDGRRVIDDRKLHRFLASTNLSAGDKAIQYFPGFQGGMNLQAHAESPLANLAAGGANATAGEKMLAPTILNPDQTLIQKDRMGQHILPTPSLASASVGRSMIPAATFNPSTAPAGIDFANAKQVPYTPELAKILTQGKTPEAFNASLQKMVAENPATLNSSFNNQISGGLGNASIVTPNPGVNVAGILAPQNRAMETMVSPPAGKPTAPGMPYTAPSSATKLTIAGDKNATALDIAEGRNATTKEIAGGKNATALEVAGIRAAAKGSTGSSSGSTATENAAIEPIDLNRLGDREKAAMEALTNAYGKSGHSINANHAALLATAATTSFPNDPAGVAVQKFMTQNGITSDTGGWSRVDFKQNGKDVDFEALRRKLFGSQPATPAAAATGAPPTPAVPGAPTITQGGLPEVLSNGGAQPAQAPAGPAKDVPQRTAKGGFVMDGISFEPGSSLSGERKHGDKYTGVNAETNQLETRYWDAENKGWSDEPIGGDQDVAGDSLDKFDVYFQRGMPSAFPSSAKADAEKSIIDEAVNAGFLDQKAVATARASGKIPDLIASVEGKFKKLYADKAVRDPRIASYAKGDFLDDRGLPDDAMKLAELTGIDRAAYGIPATGWSSPYESILQGAPGSLFLPGYGGTQDAMKSGLKQYFKDLQAGKVKTSAPPAKAQPQAKSLADVVAPKKIEKGSGMTPDEVKIMLAEQFRREVSGKNGVR